MLQNGETLSNRAPLKLSALPEQARAFQIMDMPGRCVDKSLLPRFWGNYTILQLKRIDRYWLFFQEIKMLFISWDRVSCSTVQRMENLSLLQMKHGQSSQQLTPFAVVQTICHTFCQVSNLVLTQSIPTHQWQLHANQSVSKWTYKFTFCLVLDLVARWMIGFNDLKDLFQVK